MIRKFLLKRSWTSVQFFSELKLSLVSGFNWNKLLEILRPFSCNARNMKIQEFKNFSKNIRWGIHFLTDLNLKNLLRMKIMFAGCVRG